MSEQPPFISWRAGVRPMSRGKEAVATGRDPTCGSNILKKSRDFLKLPDKRFPKLANFGPRDFYFQIFEFCACKYNSLTTRRLEHIWRQVCNYFRPKDKFFPSNGALTGSPRRARHVATACSLRCNGGPAAEPGGPYGKTREIFLRNNDYENKKSRHELPNFETPKSQNYHDIFTSARHPVRALRQSNKALTGCHGPCGSEQGDELGQIFGHLDAVFPVTSDHTPVLQVVHQSD